LLRHPAVFAPYANRIFTSEQTINNLTRHEIAGIKNFFGISRILCDLDETNIVVVWEHGVFGLAVFFNNLGFHRYTSPLGPIFKTITSNLSPLI